MTSHPLIRYPRLLATTSVALGLILVPLGLDLVTDGTVSLSLQTAAAQGHGGAEGKGAGKGKGAGQGKGGASGRWIRDQGGGDTLSILEDRIFRGKGRRTIIILEGDGEDSDRPAWARGNRELNPHAQGGGRPAGSGMKKGDLYGDLYVILRDDNGAPILDTNGHVQPILADGTVIQLTEEGDLPTEYEDQVVEVKFGRLNVSRAPSKVSEHALDDAMAKLTTASVVTLDEAGRLVVDGTTIDSPRENLSLYTYVMNGGALPNLPANFDPTSLLGAAADKTMQITVDQLVYLHSILGINTVDVANGNTTYFDFSGYDYSRSGAYAGTTVTYLADPDGDGVYETVSESLMQAVFDGQDWSDSTPGGADDFSQATDDSRAVIQFLHDVPTPTAIN